MSFGDVEAESRDNETMPHSSMRDKARSTLNTSHWNDDGEVQEVVSLGTEKSHDECWARWMTGQPYAASIPIRQSYISDMNRNTADEPN